MKEYLRRMYVRRVNSTEQEGTVVHIRFFFSISRFTVFDAVNVDLDLNLDQAFWLVSTCSEIISTRFELNTLFN